MCAVNTGCTPECNQSPHGENRHVVVKLRGVAVLNRCLASLDLGRIIELIEQEGKQQSSRLDQYNS